MVMFEQNLLLWGMMAEEKIPDNPQLVLAPHSDSACCLIHCRQILCFVEWAVSFRNVTYKYLWDRGGTVVKVLCYKSEGRLFDPSWYNWNFSLT